MKNNDIFNLHSAFLVNTALLVGFMLSISLGALMNWQTTSTLGESPTPLNPSVSLSQTK